MKPSLGFYSDVPDQHGKGSIRQPPVKYEEVYLKAYADGRDARAGIEYLRPRDLTRPWVEPRGRYSWK